MPKIQSLDELISRKAAEFADQIKAAAAMADKEEEIRIEVERQLAFLERQAGVKLQGKHEFTVASGRVDSVYNCVIIEYKNPSNAATRIGPGANAPGAKKVVEQIKSRFYDLRTKDTLNTLFGVGCDGKHFIFVRFYNDKWQVQDPVEVNKHSAERFLWALFNLGTKGKRFEPDYLAGDFGSAEGSVASPGIKVLYGAISTTTNPKAQTFFNQWKILFGEVCGYDVDNPSDKIKKLADFYGVPAKGVKPAEMLFAVHTYYALFMKLLAGEIIGHFHKLPSLIGRMIAAPSAAKLKQELGELEAGGIFRHLEITNFLEGDLFAWYLPAWSDDIEDLVRKMTARLDQYNPGTLAEEPAESRDMLKKLYQQLFPKSVRHDLGEYYTPDWLAEHVLNELGYVGDPDKRLLDPACGSGTFLVMAITRIRSWYDKNREKLRYDEGELCKKILANVVGFDLNPLAVMAARTNYLIAIRDLVSHVDKVEIPVYLCDSILTPSTYGGLFAGSTTAAKELRTSAGRFLVPTEIAQNRDDVTKYAEQLEFCVRNEYSPTEFIQRCRDEGLPITAARLHEELYEALVKLHPHRNSVWARIIKNAFAPLFTGKVEYIAGNPPWVRWAYLPQQYRRDIEFLWRRYALFTESGLQSLMGTAEVDLSLLFTYACLDYYLVDRGKLGFLITQEVIRSKSAGKGFRRFALAPTNTPLKVLGFDDMVALKPFEAANKSAFIALQRGEGNAYPVRYTEWRGKAGYSPTAQDSLETVLAQTDRRKLKAKPLGDQTSPWQVFSDESSSSLSKIAGTSSYKGRCGVSIDPYGVFLCIVQSVQRTGDIMVQNDPSLGNAVVPQMPATRIESDRAFPIVRGRDIKRWHATPKLAGIIINDSTRKDDIPTEADARRRFPHTYSYLYQMRDAATRREKFWQFFSKKTVSGKELDAEEMRALGAYVRSAGKNADGQYVYESSDMPFFVLFNVGSYTFSPFKVVWPMGASNMKAAVIDEAPLPTSGSGTSASRAIIPATGTTSYASFNEADPAHFLCALLNSTPVNAYIRSFSSAGRGFGAPSVVGKLNLPTFFSKVGLHKDIVALAKSCQTAAIAGEADRLNTFKKELDHLVGSLWGIDDAELATLCKTVPSPKRKSKT